jgi:hypothetical protein
MTNDQWKKLGKFAALGLGILATEILRSVDEESLGECKSEGCTKKVDEKTYCIDCALKDIGA